MLLACVSTHRFISAFNLQWLGNIWALSLYTLDHSGKRITYYYISVTIYLAKATFKRRLWGGSLFKKLLFVMVAGVAPSLVAGTCITILFYNAGQKAGSLAAIQTRLSPPNSYPQLSTSSTWAKEPQIPPHNHNTCRRPNVQIYEPVKNVSHWTQQR